MNEQPDKTSDAWNTYLQRTRDLRGLDYEAVEPFAWAQLKAELGSLKPKRSRRVVKEHAA